eukprot:2485985-Pyramimonas_sp.AAC.1
MKDFIDRGLTEHNARQQLRTALRASWLDLGYSEDTWQMGGAPAAHAPAPAITSDAARPRASPG